MNVRQKLSVTALSITEILISAAITIVCAVIILRHPFAAAATLWMFIGLTMIMEAGSALSRLFLSGNARRILYE